VPAYVVVQLAAPRGKRATDETADALGTLKRAPIKRLLAEHDAVRLKAADTVDVAENARTATLAVPDMVRANKLAAALRGMDGVEAAYAKPAEELP
jgi:hypothetical protein